MNVCFLILLLSLFFLLPQKQTNKLHSRPTNTFQNTTDIEKQIRQIALEKGSQDAWSYFKENYETTMPGSHDIAHSIGKLIFDQYKLAGLVYCDDSFSFGCYHGFIEEFITIEGIDHVQELTTSCNAITKLQEQLTCYHGLGHGLLTFYQYDLKKSLESCEKFSPSKFQSNCYSGVFMENAGNGPTPAKASDPLWPCTSVDKKYESSCLQYQMIFLAALYKNDTQKIADACLQLPNDTLLHDCIRGLGNQITQRNITEPKKIIQECDKTSGKSKYYCYTTAAEEYVFMKQPLTEAIRMFCDPLPTPWNTQCVTAAKTQSTL